MAYTYDEVMDLLGDEAQAVPGAIVVFRNKHVTVATTTVDNGFAVTAEGAAILAEAGSTKPAKKSRRKTSDTSDSAENGVESNMLATPTDGEPEGA